METKTNLEKVSASKEVVYKVHVNLYHSMEYMNKEKAIAEMLEQKKKDEYAIVYLTEEIRLRNSYIYKEEPQ